MALTTQDLQDCKSVQQEGDFMSSAFNFPFTELCTATANKEAHTALSQSYSRCLQGIHKCVSHLCNF